MNEILRPGQRWADAERRGDTLATDDFTLVGRFGFVPRKAELNHIIVRATDKAASAEFLARILGVPVGQPVGPFVPVQLTNGVTLDFMSVDAVTQQHYAFLIDEAGFDAAFTRIRESGTRYWADPERRRSGETNTINGGRGVYFADPDDHNMELLTRA